MAGEYKRIYIGIAYTLLALFAALSLYGVQITSDGDKACYGTEKDPCVSYLKVYNPTAKSFYIYNNDNITLDFSPEIKGYELYVKYYGKWVRTNFTSATKLSNVPKDAKYVFVFPRYSTKEFKLVGYKVRPTDRVKWGFGILRESYIDPVWDNPLNATSDGIVYNYGKKMVTDYRKTNLTIESPCDALNKSMSCKPCVQTSIGKNCSSYVLPSEEAYQKEVTDYKRLISVEINNKTYVNKGWINVVDGYIVEWTIPVGDRSMDKYGRCLDYEIKKGVCSETKIA